MKPEVANAPRSASERLAEARAIQAAGIARVAAREPYPAAFTEAANTITPRAAERTPALAALLIDQIAAALAHTSETD
jgi:hypothetical protein